MHALLIASLLLLPQASPVATPPAAPAAAPEAQDSPARVEVTFTKYRMPGQPAPRDVDEIGREVVGRLTYSQVTVEADDRPVREVLQRLGRSLGINVVPFYEGADRPAPRLGISTAARATLDLHDVTGRAALDALAAQCGPEVTWQIHRGMLEFGPREALARDDARRTVVYDVTDLCLEAPYFTPGGSQGRPSDRLRPKDIAADLVRSISEQCEPTAFEPAPPPSESEIEEGARRPQVPHKTPAPTQTNPRSDVNTTATRNLDPDAGPVFVKGQWAQIHLKDRILVVTAPDFVHRAIGGYAPPIPPPPK